MKGLNKLGDLFSLNPGKSLNYRLFKRANDRTINGIK